MSFEIDLERDIAAPKNRVLTAFMYDWLTADPWTTEIAPVDGVAGAYRITIMSPDGASAVRSDVNVTRSGDLTEITFTSINENGWFRGRVTAEANGATSTTLRAHVKVLPSPNGLDKPQYEQIVRSLLDRVTAIAQLLDAPGRQLRREVLDAVAPVVAERHVPVVPTRDEIGKSIDVRRDDPEFIKRLDDVWRENSDMLKKLAGSNPQHLRHYPVAVHARGPAVRVVNRAVARYVMARGDVIGYSTPGSWLDPASNTSPKAHLLIVPLDASATNYPRSINGVPVRITRSPMPELL
jgi:hypothetical protein